jgi:hypothetical protein
VDGHARPSPEAPRRRVILHLVAFLIFLLITGLFLISGEATKQADDSGK